MSSFILYVVCLSESYCPSGCILPIHRFFLSVSVLVGDMILYMGTAVLLPSFSSWGSWGMVNIGQVG